MWDETLESMKNEVEKYYLWPFWRPFIVAWAVINWQAIYVTLFVSEERIWEIRPVDKLSYLLGLYDWTIPGFTIWTWNIESLNLRLVAMFVFWVILPFAGALANTFFIAPRVRAKFMEKEHKTKTDERIMVIEEEKRFEEKRWGLIKIQEANVIKEEEVVKKQKAVRRSKTQEESWIEEYNETISNKTLREGLQHTYKAIYQYRWDVSRLGGYSFPPRALALLVANEVIQKTNDHIDLTKKGQFFMKNYLQENPDA